MQIVMRNKRSNPAACCGNRKRSRVDSLWRVPRGSGGRTLLKGGLTGIVRARKLSKAAIRNIRENLFFASITARLA